jgi:GntR family transcriptional regulator / MocR family aminotransferase
VPLYEQLRQGIKHLINTGILRPGERMPSTRHLSMDLRVARSVIVETYAQLTAEGYLAALPRSGTRVADAALAGTGATKVPGEPEGIGRLPVRWDLRTGLADGGGFPRKEWLASLEDAIMASTTSHLEYPPVCGLPELRTELSAYLGRVRAVQAAPEHIMITLGYAQGLSLIAEALLDQGHRAIAVEDPGHPGERQFLGHIGLRIIGVPVDDEGVDVAALSCSGARAVLLTPAHQFPTGVVLSARRRAALIKWTRKVGGLVIEDDYDGEFWFGGPGRPSSLQGLGPDCVAYGGSASKTLAPGLRIGWFAVPPALMPTVERIKMRRDMGHSTICQLAYANFMTSGRLDRHIRRMNLRYAERRQALLSALESEVPDAEAMGAPSGLHCLVRLPMDLDERRVVRAARSNGIVVRDLGTLYCELAPGLLIGFAAQPPDSLAQATRVLAQTIRTLRP